MMGRHSVVFITALSARSARPGRRTSVRIVRANWFGVPDGEFLPSAKKQQRIGRKSKSEIIRA